MIRKSERTEARRTLATLLAAGLFALASAGCGNDSSGSDGDPEPPGDTAAPALAVTFPPPDTLTDAAEVTVRGSAFDPSGVLSIRVDDVEAESTDGFATWTATVPLEPGANELQVRAEDLAGNATFPPLAWTVTRAEERLVTPTALAFDAARAQLIGADAALDRVSTVDPAGGAVATLSDTGSSGLALVAPSGADVDPGRDRALVVDRARGELIAVDLTDGARSVLEQAGSTDDFRPIDVAVDPFRDVAYVSEVERGIVVVDLQTGAREALGGGTGTVVEGIGGVAIDEPRARVLATRAGAAPALLAFDLATGATSVVSGGTVGSGPELVAPLDVALDPSLSRAIVSDAGARAILSIDLVSGERSVVSSAQLGLGPELAAPGPLVVDAFGRVDVLDLARDAVLRVELVGGDRTLLAGTSVGTGIALSQPVSLVVLPPGVLVLDAGLDALITIDDATRERALLSGRGAGSGPELVEPVRVVLGSFWSSSARTYVADVGLDAILGVSLAGDRTEVSGPLVGAGPAFLGPRDMVVLLEDGVNPEPRARWLVVADSPDVGDGRLVVVDAMTGDRVVHSASGPPLVRPVALELLGADRVVVLDEAQDALLVLDLGTGGLTLLSATGQGPAFHPSAPKDLLIDADQERVLVTDSGNGRIVAVSLPDGTRTVLSDDAEGGGPRLVAPAGIAAGPPPLRSGSSVDESRSSTRVVDAERGAVFVLDPDGNRVLWAK